MCVGYVLVLFVLQLMSAPFKIVPFPQCWLTRCMYAPIMYLGLLAYVTVSRMLRICVLGQRILSVLPHRRMVQLLNLQLYRMLVPPLYTLLPLIPEKARQCGYMYTYYVRGPA